MKNKRKYLHICTYTLFNDPYIKFINKNFIQKDHLFLILTNKGKVLLENNVKKTSKNIKNLLSLIKESYKCEKIFLHGLVHREIVLLFFFQPWLLKKCYWVIFGEDLYFYEFRENRFLSNLYEFARGFVIKRLYGLITYIKGDYDLAKKWYRLDGIYFNCLLYPNNLFKNHNLDKIINRDNKIYIQVGNSADPAHNHFKVFDKLKVYTDKPIEIVCPLAYGYDDYRDKVINEGVKIFGDKFKPMTELISTDDYSKFLSKIDIAIFNHKGQRALGNIIELISLGKKVYIRDNITTWNLCQELGIKIYSYNNDFNSLFEKMPEDARQKNIENIRKNFSEEKLIKQWKLIFK